MEVNEPIVEYNQLNLDKEYTYLDYMSWKFSERVELIKGKIFKMSPGPNNNHQRVITNVGTEMLSLFKKQPCNVFLAPFDVRLYTPNQKKNYTVVQPDLCIICNEDLLDKQGCNGSPDLVVEILSPTNTKHDLKTKFELYEECGIKEYWIIDIENRIVLIYVLQNGKYIGLKPFTLDMETQSILFPKLKVAVNDIFYRVKTWD